MRRMIWIPGVVIVVLFAGMQFRQPNFDLTPGNPAAGFETQLHPSSRVHNVLRKSCYSCHSAQNQIPWYGHIWPASALMESDIRRARARMDFSNWSNLGPEMSHLRLVSACRAMRESRMPVWYYQPLHPGSAPTKEEVETFCGWVYSSPLHPELALLR